MENEKLFDLIEKMYMEMKQGFEKVDKRFEQVDKRFEQVDKRFENVEARLDDIEKTVTKIEVEHGEKLSALFDGYKQNSEKLSRIEDEVSKQEEIILKRVR